ncbi:MAG: hypothetical protein LBD84_03955 [Campylobacteraceae bacterium]|jgi:hypothetical protein|nr:hypothetical protein [Campylobacteraceae bacterium]
MKALMNFFVMVLSIVVLAGCGGGGNGDNPDTNLPYVEKSDFFTSFALFYNNDTAVVSKGLVYYPISDSIYDDFEKDILAEGFTINEDGENCYMLDNETAVACSDMDNASDKRYISIWFDNTTIDVKEEEIIEFFPKIDAPLSARVLLIDFDDNKSTALMEHENYLEKTLKFEYYDYNYDGYYIDKCLKEDKKGDIVYLFCYNEEDYYAEWTISRKIFFDAMF